MKKISVLLTVFVLGAMLLAACGPGVEGEGTPGVDNNLPDTGLETPGMGLETPATGFETEPGALETPAEGMETDTVEPTMAATDGTAATPAVGDTTPTVETGSGTLPQAGAAQFVLLSDVLSMSVNGQDGQTVGNINGVLIDRPSGAASDSMDSDTMTAPSTTESTDGDMTATVTPDAGAYGTDSGSMVLDQNARVSFVLVNVTGAGASGSSDTGTSGTDATDEATPAATVEATTDAGAGATGDTGSMGASESGNQVLVPWQAFEVTSADTSDTASIDDTALTLTADASVLAGAPAFSESEFAGTVSEDVTAYWSSEGLTIPMTGAEAEMGESVLVRGQIGSLQVNGQDGQSFGQVRDFVVDSTTGELVYAILGGGQAAAGDLFVAPFSVLAWSESQGAAASGGEANSLGSFDLKVSSDQFDSAPTITSEDELDFSTSDWQTEIDSYWSKSILDK